MTENAPPQTPRSPQPEGKGRPPKSLRPPLAAFALTAALLAAVRWSSGLVPAAWAPGPSFGSAAFYALYPNPANPDQADAAVVNLRVWGRGDHVSTGLRIDLWWEHTAFVRPVAHYERWKQIPDSLKGAARMAGTPVLVDTRAEADDWVKAELVAALKRTNPDLADALSPAVSPPTTYVIRHVDRVWAERLLSCRQMASYVLLGLGAVTLGWASLRYEALAHARSLARRGLCGRCGYPREGLRADATCPECGGCAALKPDN